jgi:eukaryotic-like serine/threonine-protein kinase
VSYTTSDTFSAGLVISQSIAGGTTEPLYTPVSFVVSSGPTVPILTTTVPNVVGLPSYQAGSTVSNDGLIINTFLYATSNTVPAGYVISQSLTAGSVVPTGTIISLAVSLGVAPVTPTTTVPNVTGLYLWDVVRILTAAQIIVEPWIYAASNSVTEEYVISQTLTAGQTVLAWSPIVITVSSGVY